MALKVLLKKSFECIPGSIHLGDDNAPCSKCGHLFTITKINKCVKCSLVGYYRVIFEMQLFGYKHESKRNTS